MKRLTSIIAATAAAAAVAAAISLPAGADGGSRASASDALDRFASCLREHDLAVPTGLDAIALKTWLGDHEDGAGFQEAVEACDPKRDGRRTASGPGPEELVACLRDRGLAPPSSSDELKPWLAQQAGTAEGRAALGACGTDSPPESSGGCAGEKRPSAERARAWRVKPAAGQ